jgi:hypothetical protein
MANRDPVSYILYTSKEYGSDAEWTEEATYTLREMALRGVEALTVQGYRVKYQAVYPNGITTYRIIEGAGRHIVAPTPAPSPEPPPAPTPAPMFDFQEASNFINFVTFLR